MLDEVGPVALDGVGGVELWRGLAGGLEEGGLESGDADGEDGEEGGGELHGGGEDPG